MDNTSEEYYYRFGITVEKYDFLVFGIRIEFMKVAQVNLPSVVLDFYKYSYTFGWCEINNKTEILK